MINKNSFMVTLMNFLKEDKSQYVRWHNCKMAITTDIHFHENWDRWHNLLPEARNKR